MTAWGMDLDPRAPTLTSAIADASQLDGGPAPNMDEELGEQLDELLQQDRD